MKSPSKIMRQIRNRVKLDRKTFVLYSVLRLLVVLTGIRCLFTGNYQGTALCILALFLFLLPSLFEEELKVDIPPAFEALIYLFIYAAEILGEVNLYFVKIKGWDTMLHTINGFLAAAIGFSLVYVLNRNSKNLDLSPLYVAAAAFCFSMTIGVIWEFFEFSVDHLLNHDMQKDTLIHTVTSGLIGKMHDGNPETIRHINKTVIETSGGRTYTVNGYVDVGIIDTMKDLFVNFIGALVFSITGYYYVKNLEAGIDKKSVAGDLLLRPLSDEELREQDEELNEEEQARVDELREKIRQIKSRAKERKQGRR